MSKLLLFFSLFLLPLGLAAQANFNLTQVANLPYSSQLSNIWGYTAPNGTEYALVGTDDGTSIVSLANPASPLEVAFVDGQNSIWRELKVWGNYCYVVADATRDGILIIDMSNLPNSVSHQFYKPYLSVNGQTDTLIKGHTLYIDENGYLYVSGSNLNAGGVLIFDINANPTAPVYLGYASDNIYAHDCYVRGDTLWTADIFDGTFSVYDVSNKSNPIFLANQQTPSTFTHNIWISGDGRTVFTTDEVADAYVTAYDVSDLSNIRELDRYRSRGAATVGVIPHNAHVIDDYVVTSYYTDGVIVLDGSRPNNMVEVARFDTYLGSNVGFFGDWGVYPYFPSGLMIISDMNTGLHIFQPNYQRACWLEGLVTEQGSNNPIFGASVQILSNNLNEATDLQGQYRTGLATAGVYTVQVSKAGYQNYSTTVQLQSGQVTILDVQLQPAAAFGYAGRVQEQGSNAPIANALVEFRSSNGLYNYSTSTDNAGNFSVAGFYPENYDVLVGHWGHHSLSLSQTAITSASAAAVYTLTKGYKDEFALDLGWSVASVGTTRGDWELCVPYLPAVYNPQGLLTTPAADVAGDIGNQCYLTDNGENGQAGYADVDDGVTRLISPNMDLSAYTNGYIYFNYWFVNEQGSASPNDTFTVQLIDNVANSTQIIGRYTPSQRAWSPSIQLRLADFGALSANMQVAFVASDTGAARNLVEAGVDNFLVSDSLMVSISQNATEANPNLVYFPNPFTYQIQIVLAPEHKETELHVYNQLGQLIETVQVSNGQQTLQMGAGWQAGLYYVRGRSQTIKLIKL